MTSLAVEDVISSLEDALQEQRMLHCRTEAYKAQREKLEEDKQNLKPFFEQHPDM